MALVMFASKLVGGLPGEVGRGPARELRQHDPRPRPHHLRRGRRRTADGEVQGLRVKTYANLGGRLSTIGPGIPTTLYGRVLAGPVQDPQRLLPRSPGVYTNTTFVDAYRGAGRPEATYVVERAMDLLADELGIDPAEVRRRNFLPPDSLPVRQPVRAADRGQRLEAVHRLGQLRARDGQGARDGRLRRHRGEEGRGEGPRQAPRRRPVDLHRGLRRRAHRSGSARSARAGAPRCGRAPTSRSTSPARPWSRWAPSRRARATRPPTRRSSATSWASRWTTSSSSTRTPRARRSATGRTARRTSNVGTGAALKAAAKIREKARRYAAHMLEASARRHRDRRRRVPGQGLAREDEDPPGDRVRARPRVRHARGHGAVSRRDGLPRHAQLHVPVRDAHRDRRDRRGDRARSTSCATSRSTTSARRSTR